MDQKTKNFHIERVKRDGFTIVESAFERSLADELNATLERLECEHKIKPAMNGFEGHKTVRIYNLLAHGAPFTLVPVHASRAADRRRRARRGLPDLVALLDRHRSGRDGAADPCRRPWSSRSTSRIVPSSATRCGR